MSTTQTLANPDAARGWRMAAIALLAVRFVQGWIYWGGGTRRFIYAPSKIDPSAHWMAYKFQTAMPGALLGTDHLVAWLLQHFAFLYIGIVVFSAVEMIAGAMLIIGLFTRIAAVATIGLSIALMLLFGWQGATCIDEWTMAAANFAIGITLFLAGGGAYSVDSWLARRKPRLAGSGWFNWIGGASLLPLSERAFKRLALVLVWISVAFIVLTYNYYRGSVVTPFHGGPTSPSKHHWTLSQGQLAANGTVRFHAYVDAGTPAEPSNVLRASLISNGGQIIEEWDGMLLARTPKQAFKNDFPYQKIHSGKFGLIGPVGAEAMVELRPTQSGLSLPNGPYTLQLVSVNGHIWSLPLTR